MEKNVYEEKKEDYKDLLKAAGELLERFKDYTPDNLKELDELVEKACLNCQDLAKGEELFHIIRNYIKFRYTELKEYRERRAKAEKKFMEDLPGVFEMLAVPNDDSCETIASVYKKYDKKDNYQVLVKEIIRILCEV